VRAHFILYVRDQHRARDFYASVLAIEPRLDVPGMTEFQLGEDAVLGLMPEEGIARLLQGRVRPDLSRGIPRAELYLMVDDVPRCHARALSAGATELSPPAARDWGDVASYVGDLDGHVLAFANAG